MNLSNESFHNLNIVSLVTPLVFNTLMIHDVLFVIMNSYLFFRYDETTIVKTTVNSTKEAVNEKLNECKKWHTVHCVCSVLLILNYCFLDNYK